MMQNLKIFTPETGHFNCYCDIANAKYGDRRVRLNDLNPTIQDRYLEYEQNSGDLISIDTRSFSNDEKNDLLHCYETETAPLIELKAQIRKVQKGGICQYCGFGEATTFDHFLPKGFFPELCVLPINLIPCCSDCNSKKGSRWKDDNNLLFLNLYYDQLPSDKIYLFATIDYDKSTTPTTPIVNFTLHFNENNTFSLEEVVQSHYQLLNLFERYKYIANEFVSEKYYELASCNDVDSSMIRDELIKAGRRLRKQYGCNYWKSAILDALAQSEDFIASCIKKDWLPIEEGH
jgi:5-methylcytosine-specific restriction endonuclease McrA